MLIHLLKFTEVADTLRATDFATKSKQVTRKVVFILFGKLETYCFKDDSDSEINKSNFVFQISELNFWNHQQNFICH